MNDATTSDEAQTLSAGEAVTKSDEDDRLEEASPRGRARLSIAHGTLTDASLPGTAFHPREFDVELSQTSLAEADELLKSTLDEAMIAVGGNRAFLALIDTLTGELALRFTVGEGWTENIRHLRVNMRATERDDVAAADLPPLPKMYPPPSGSRQGITRHVVANGRRYWTGDVSRDPYYIGFFDDVKSEVAVPITARGGGIIGVVNIESPDADAFTEEHANLVSVLARRIAVIVAMAEHQLREEALIAIGKDLNTSSDTDVLMEHVVEQATKILRADDCSLFLIDEDSETLQLAASYGPLGKSGEQNIRYRLGEGLTGWVAQHGESIRVGDPRTDPRWKGVFMEAPAGELASVMAVPVRSHRGISGVLRVVRHRKGSLYFLPQEFTQADEDVLVTLAGQLAVAIDRTRLLNRLLNSERMAAWGEMSARSAHMIGNAVFGVKGHLNELTHWFSALNEGDLSSGSRDKTSDSGAAPLRLGEWDEARFLLENITRGIYRLESILGEFRDFVLATQLHATPRDVNQILRNVTAETFPRHSNIDLVLNLAPSLPPVLADEAKLKRAFSELIENSVDFQPHGGMLTIRTAPAEKEMLREFGRGQVSAPALQIEFIDHGPGLSQQDRERVFTPFYTRKAKGMGLGLSIVKGIVEAHRGAIREIGDADTALSQNMAAQGTRTHGAHFIIFLPVGDEETPDQTSGRASVN